jgi:hypothetical protein
VESDILQKVREKYQLKRRQIGDVVMAQISLPPSRSYASKKTMLISKHVCKANRKSQLATLIFQI